MIANSEEARKTTQRPNTRQCEACASARGFLWLLLREVQFNEHIHLVALSAQHHCTPFAVAYVACDRCEGSGLIRMAPATEVLAEG